MSTISFEIPQSCYIGRKLETLGVLSLFRQKVLHRYLRTGELLCSNDGIVGINVGQKGPLQTFIFVNFLIHCLRFRSKKN